MINFVITLLEKLASVLESAVKREEAKLQDKLEQASKLVTEANAHRRSIRKARQVAGVCRAVVADTADAPQVVVAQEPADKAE